MRGMLTFAAGRAEAEEVDLTAFALFTRNPRLALTLTTLDVTLPAGRANRAAVAPEKSKITK